jgi:hypothetical protein
MKRLLVCVILSGLLLLCALPLFSSDPGDVIIGDEVVLRIRFPAGGYTVEQRADAVTQRINNVLGSRPFSPEDVRVAQQNGEWVVMIGNELIITADGDTAKYNHSTPEELANTWAANLRRAIPQAKSKSTG